MKCGVFLTVCFFWPELMDFSFWSDLYFFIVGLIKYSFSSSDYDYLPGFDF